MNGSAIRLLATAALVFLTYLGVDQTKKLLKLPPAGQLPVDIAQLPMKLGDWQGEDRELDPKTFDATGADLAVYREYHDNEGHAVDVLLGLYRTDPDAGVYHAPTNCYRSNGWRLIDDSMIDVPISKTASQRVHLSTWDKQSETIYVMFWYRLGDYTLFERWDMGGVRWKMRGQASWPPLVKILLQTPVTQRDEFHCKARIQEVAAQVQRWLNQPNAGEKPQRAGK
jgi:EpsI family protein